MTAAAPRCPRCEGVDLEGFALPSGSLTARCPRCRGVWCSRAELAELIEVTADHPLVTWEGAVPTRTDRGCPTCVDTALESVKLPGGELSLGHCAACDGAWVDGGALPRLVALAAAPRARPKVPSRRLRAREEQDPRFAYDTPWVNGLALPVAFLLALGIELSPFGALLSIVTSMPLHELGHAAAAWLSGHFALPLPFFTIGGPDERSLLVALTLTVALAAVVLLGVREQRRYLVALGGGALVLQAALTLAVPNWRTLRIITWAGCAGEIALATLLVVSFHYRLPDRWRWDFTRYLALFAGASGLVHAGAFWIDVARRGHALPYGTAIGGNDDPNGDMNKLVGWGGTPAGISSGYLTLLAVAALVVMAHHGVFLVRALRREKARAAPP